MNRITDTNWWKWVRLVLEIVGIAAIIWTAIHVFTTIGSAHADDMHETAYILCDDHVNVRRTPDRKHDPIGRFETGDVVYLDGKTKNGFVHCVNLSLEEDSGWIHKGYIVYDKPEVVGKNATIVSKGKLAARKNVGGKRMRWLKPQATVKVLYWSDEWCVTNCGYVQSRYLELDGD